MKTATPLPLDHVVDEDVVVHTELAVLRALLHVARATPPTMIMSNPDVADHHHVADAPHEARLGRVIISLIQTLVDAIEAYDAYLCNR